jgi:glycolate oxidase FAD binding subunit
MAERELVLRLRRLLGDAALGEAVDAHPPIVLPSDEAQCALLLRTASLEGWRVAIAGARTWDAPPEADVILSTDHLTTLGPIDVADLVGTAAAGVRWSTLRRMLADQGAWLAQDAPGADRTLGSILATGTSGPLRAGFGGARDHVLGLTLVTGDGRVVHAGGRVVKNVAGYDVAKLALGSFGAFGIITSVHFRLRAVPRADTTLLTLGSRDTLLDAGRAIHSSGLCPGAMELLSPTAGRASEWTLAVRLLGTDAEVAAERNALHAAAPLPWTSLPSAEAGAFWPKIEHAVLDRPVTLRVGADPTSLEQALDLVALHLDERVTDWLTATLTAGVIRWSGNAQPHELRRLRNAAAQLEWPLTLERAPWEVRAAVGRFGAYREGVGLLVQRLRAAFDPAGVLVTGIDATS